MYGYDKLDRLTYAERGVLNGTDNGIVDGGTGRAWSLDLHGNWSGSESDGKSVKDYTTVAGSLPGFSDGTDTLRSYTHHNTDEVNRITSRIVDDTPGDGNTPDPIPFVHDAAGSLIDDGDKTFKYDAWNRIKEVKRKSDGALVAKYDYDALGRRIAKTVGTESTAYFYYDGHRVIEHHQGNAGGVLSLHRQFVYGLNYIDEPVAFYDASAAIHFTFQDAGYDVAGVTDSDGVLEEQYSFKPYGERLAIEDGAGAAVASGVPVLSLGYKGLREEAETGLWYNRARDLNSHIGRFQQKDPNESGLLILETMLRNAQTPLALVSVRVGTQYTDGMNLYQYAGSNPVNVLDPTGLFEWFSAADDISAQIQADRIAAAEEVMFFLEQALRATKTIAFQALMTATVPGAGLYFATKGLAAAIEDIGESGFGFWNSLNAVASITGVAGSAGQIIKNARRLRGYVGYNKGLRRTSPGGVQTALQGFRKVRFQFGNQSGMALPLFLSRERGC